MSRIARNPKAKPFALRIAGINIEASTAPLIQKVSSDEFLVGGKWEPA
jgi:hypothetical protein